MKNHVAHKHRDPTLFNDQMNEIYNFVRSKKAVWRRLIKDKLYLRLRPLFWDSPAFGPRWLMEMSFTDWHGLPAHTRGHTKAMPSKSPAQKKLMSAAAHNPKFAKKVGVPSKVAKEFHNADRGKYGHKPKGGKK